MLNRLPLVRLVRPELGRLGVLGSDRFQKTVYGVLQRRDEIGRCSADQQNDQRAYFDVNCLVGEQKDEQMEVGDRL